MDTPNEQQMNIDELMQDLHVIMGIDDMPEEERDEVLALMMETVLDNALISTAEVLDDESRADMYARAQSLPPSEFFGWIAEEHTIFLSAIMLEFQGFLARLQQDLAAPETPGV